MWEMAEEGSRGAAATNSSANRNLDESEKGSVVGIVAAAVAAGRGVKREYKKDTIYLYDLYTLTYDNNEQVETIGMFNTIENENVSTFVIGEGRGRDGDQVGYRNIQEK